MGEGGVGAAQHTVIAEDGEAGEEHGGIDEECRAEMRRQAVLGDARVGSGSKEVVFKTAFYHPPAYEALEADQSTNSGDLPCH